MKYEQRLRRLYRNTDVYNILAWVLILSAFVYTVIRAYSVSIIHDEAETYYISLGSFLDILTYRFATANNHLLNTVLIKILIGFLGLSEFVMRIPALIGHSMYLAGIYRILKTFLRGKLFLSGICLLLFNPFTLELFSDARGYALGLGFLTLGIYFSLMGIKNARSKSYMRNMVLASWMLALATLSNLAFLNVYISLITLIAGYEFMGLFVLIRQKVSLRFVFMVLKHFLKKVTPLIVPSLLLLVIYTFPIYKLVKLNQLHYGGVKGFWADTVTSLIKSTLYGKTYYNINLLLLMKLLIIAVFCIASALLLYKWFTRQKFKLIDKYLLGMMALLLACFSGVVLQWYLLNTKYVIGRTAVYFVTIFLIVFLIVAGYISISSNKFIRISTHWLFCFLALISLVHFYNCANFSYYYLWPWDASAKTIMSYLEGINEGKNLEDNSVSIGNYLGFTRSINFYKAKNNLSWLKWAVWTGPDGKFDYYLLTKRKNVFGHSRSAETLKIIEKYNLRTIKWFDSGCFLAIPKNRGKEQDVTKSITPYNDLPERGERFVVSFVAKELTWIKIAVDGKYPFEIMLMTDEPFRQGAARSMKVKADNPEDISLYFNGIPLKIAGEQGMPFTLQFPDAARGIKIF